MERCRRDGDGKSHVAVLFVEKRISPCEHLKKLKTAGGVVDCGCWRQGGTGLVLG